MNSWHAAFRGQRFSVFRKYQGRLAKGLIEDQVWRVLLRRFALVRQNRQGQYIS
jgi:hypothetical protein